MATPSSGTARKLGIREGGRLVLIGAPAGWGVTDLPAGVEVSVLDGAPSVPLAGDTVVIAFFRRAVDYLDMIAQLAPAIHPAVPLWAAWPRRAGGHTSDITDNVIRDAALALGLVDIKVAAIDEDWSGLRLVWRRELRAGRPGTGR